MVGWDQSGVGAGQAGAGTRPPCPGAVAAGRPRTPLFGRADEVASALGRLRRGEVRLVTLTGLSGVGKTRLALELAHASGRPAWLVEAGPWLDAGHERLRRVGRGVAGAGADADPRGGEDVPALLVVDDVPPGRAAAIALGRLLDACSGLVVVATAAAPLRIHGEQLLRVGPLPVPERGMRPETLAAVPSVALFLDACTRNDDRFWAGAEGLLAAAEICRRLGGLPLALELAAARSATTPLPLLARLLREDNPLALLDGGPDDGPERHGSLRAALTGSFDALRSIEREMAVLVAGQPGAATWETIHAAVAAAGAIDADRALGVLAGLVDAGVVQVVPRSDGDRAFALAPLLRDLVADRDGWPAAELRDGSLAPVLDLRDHGPLTARERQVLALLAEGLGNKEIARTLGISAKTVMHHSGAIYRKLGVNGRAQAIDHAHRLDLLPARRPDGPADAVTSHVK